MRDVFRHVPDGLKHALDGLSLFATLGVLVQWLPALSALLSCIWLGIRIFESETVQSLIKRK